LLPEKAPPTGLPPGAVLIEDPYRKAAIAERDRLVAAGATLPEGYTSRLTKGLGLNWTDEIMAGMTTPLEMIKRGVGPVEAYRYAKAREDLETEKARENTGALGTAVEVLGGLATGGRGVLGATLPKAGAVVRQVPGVMGAIGRYAGNVGKAAAIGGVAGAGEGNTLEERALSGVVGTVLGGVIGAAAPPVVNTARWAAQPLTNQLRRLAASPTSPFGSVEDVAAGQISRTIDRSGKTAEQIAREVADANASGQPYILAEGIGTEGQRRLAGIAKSPGAARQWIDRDLGERDLGRGLRAQEAVETGLGVPRGQTGQEAQMALTREAQTASRPYYEAAEAMQPVWTPRLQQFFEHPDFKRALGEGFHAERTRALTAGRDFNPRDYAVTDFNEAGDPILGAVPNMRSIHLMKLGIDRMINKHRNPVTGRVDTADPAVRELQGAQAAFLREVDSLNPAYAQARAAYAGPAQIRTAVERGQDIPMGGRPEDTIRRFETQTPAVQQGERIGIADRVAQMISKGSETGPLPAYLRNAKGRQELDWLSLHQGPRQPIPPNQLARASDPARFQPDPLRRALEREATMRSTFSQARGGSQTAENLADMADNLPAAPDIVGVGSNLLSGNWLGAAKALAPAAQRGIKGETEAQRTAMARILMERDPNEIAAIMQRIKDLQARQRAAAAARAGAATGALAPSLTGTYTNRRP
jgi:hypothetical protein